MSIVRLMVMMPLLSIYRFSHYNLKDRKYLSYILKMKFGRLITLNLLMSRFGLRILSLFGIGFFFLNLLRSMIHTSKIWKFLTVADFEFIEQKKSDQNIHGKIFCVAFFVFSTNINKLFNWFCINFPKKISSMENFSPKWSLFEKITSNRKRGLEWKSELLIN